MSPQSVVKNPSPLFATADRWGGRIVLLALPCFLFWNITLGGVNLGPGDLLIVLAGGICMLSGTIQFAGSKVTAIATVVFLLTGLVSLVFTPALQIGILDYIQYFYIFVVVVPVCLTAAASQRLRYHAALIYWATLFVIVLLSLPAALTTNNISKFAGVFQSYAQFRWLLAVGSIYAAAFALSANVHKYLRAVSAISLLIMTPIIFAGITLSAMLAYVSGLFVVVGWWAWNQEEKVQRFFMWLSATSAVAGLGFIAVVWPTIYRLGSLDSRFEMYEAAVYGGIAGIPFGNGLGSSYSKLVSYGLDPAIPPVVHNFILHYFFEIGLIGAIMFVIITVDWVRCTLGSLFNSPKEWKSFDVAFVAVFAAYLVVAFWQPPPIRRIWWVHFAFAWAATNDLSSADLE